jgi:hypothetical protein
MRFRRTAHGSEDGRDSRLVQAVRIGPNVRTSVDFPARGPTDNSLRFGEPRSICRCGSTHGAGCGERSWDNLIGLMDAGDYVRYDFRTATRLQQLAAGVRPPLLWHRRIHALRVIADGAHLDLRHHEASLARFTLAYRDMRTRPGSARAAGGSRGDRFVVLKYLRGALPSPALSGSGTWGSPTGVSFSACYGSLVVSQTSRIMRSTGNACPGPEVPIRHSTRRGTRSRTAARVCGWRPRALRRRDVAHGERLERFAQTGRTPLDELWATSGCFVDERMSGRRIGGRETGGQ